MCSGLLFRSQSRCIWACFERFVSLNETIHHKSFVADPLTAHIATGLFFHEFSHGLSTFDETPWKQSMKYDKNKIFSYSANNLPQKYHCNASTRIRWRDPAVACSRRSVVVCCDRYYRTKKIAGL
jgi:sulfatase maturation enzyme AslB (radical SAM superfamily)